MTTEADTALRAMTDDGAFRVMVVGTSRLCRQICQVQHAQGANAQFLAELLTATVLVRETMAPNQRVQGILEGGESGRLVADAEPGGDTRGLLWRREGHEQVSVEEGSLLHMMRTLPNRQVHQGIIRIDQPGGVSAALMAYMQRSEQVVSMAAVGCTLDDEGLPLAVGGYLLQLLPEVKMPPLAILTERLRDFADITPLLAAQGAQPERMLAELLYGFAHTRLDQTPLRFRCRCNELRVLASLAALPRADIESLLADGQPVQMRCDYCDTAYSLQPSQLRGLLSGN